MAVTMNTAEINDEIRNNLKSSEVDRGILGGDPYVQPSELVGITSEFAEAISSAIDNYCTTIEKILDELEARQSEQLQAFRGENITGAMTNFIVSVKEVSKAYLTKLKIAEKQIVTSVASVYRSQDASVSDDLKGDSDKLSV